MADVKAIVFDTFGTVVDWRSSITIEGAAWGKCRALNTDWADFADRWHLGYKSSVARVCRGEIPWSRLDDLHRAILDGLLKDFKIEDLTEEEKVRWTHVWRRLKPWPDAVEGPGRLKKKHIIAPMSNGNIAMMTNLAKFSGFTLGRDFRRRTGPPLQAGRRNVSLRALLSRSPTRASHDVRGPCLRPASRRQPWAVHRIPSPVQTNTAADRPACPIRRDREISTSLRQASSTWRTNSGRKNLNDGTILHRADPIRARILIWCAGVSIINVIGGMAITMRQAPARNNTVDSRTRAKNQRIPRQHNQRYRRDC